MTGEELEKAITTRMKRVAVIVLCLSVFGLIAPARGYGKTTARSRAKTVTVTGCVKKGVECMILVSLDGKRTYSLPHDDRLKAGGAYRVTGTIQDMSTCMQGQFLKPRKITRLRTHCPAQ